MSESKNKSAAGKSQGFSDFEKAAMKERAKELKAEERALKDRAVGEKDLLTKLEEMPELDRAMGTRIHELIQATAPELFPRTWYGMPAYTQNGKVVCFFQSGQKFQTRYCTLGFSDSAKLDEDNMWATSFALTALTPAVEARIVDLVKKAIG